MNVRATTAETASSPAADDVRSEVGALVARAREAQRVFEHAGQTALDTAAAAAAWAIMEPGDRKSVV